VRFTGRAPLQIGPVSDERASIGEAGRRVNQALAQKRNRRRREPGLGGALARVQALLAEDGFKVETRTEGAEDVIAATRMSTPEALRDEAACPLEAMRRPDFSATDLDVRLGPATGVRTVSRFVLVDTNLISGDLTRQTCRSNGALEAAVRRAAAR
jgi:hypothetical protein